MIKTKITSRLLWLMFYSINVCFSQASLWHISFDVSHQLHTSYKYNSICWKQRLLLLCVLWFLLMIFRYDWRVTVLYTQTAGLLLLINVLIKAQKKNSQPAPDKAAKTDNVNRNQLCYLVTDSNVCVENAISKPFPYLSRALPFKSIASHFSGAMRSWDAWQLFLCFIRFFLLERYGEDIPRDASDGHEWVPFASARRTKRWKGALSWWLTSYSWALCRAGNLPLWMLELSHRTFLPFL